MAGKIIKYDGDEFKCIDCVAEYADYHTIFVAKEPHFDDENGRSFQVINTAWGKGKILHHVFDSSRSDGYYQFHLPRVSKKKPTVALLHRLVFMTWQTELPVNYRELDINHIDEDKSNNQINNLELITHHQNCIWGTRNQRVADKLVKNAKTARMAAIEIQTKREYHFRTTCECARTLNLDQGNITHCLAGRQHSQKGYVFCREEDYSSAKVDELIATATQRKTKN